MAYGDMTINYPIVRPAVGSGVNGLYVVWRETVVSGPARVGDSGTFVMQFDYVRVDGENNGGGVYRTAFTRIFVYNDYADYSGVRPDTIDLQGQLYPPGDGRPSTFTREFSVAEGWRYIELAGQVYGRQYDPTPFGSFDGTTLQLWEGSQFTVSGGIVHTTTDYAQLTATGVDRVDYLYRGSDGAFFAVDVRNAADQVLQDTAYFYVPDPDGVSSRPFALAPSSANRIWRVTVTGRTQRRTGSFFATWTFGDPPNSSGGGGTGGTNVQHGGMVVATDTARGELRAFQSAMHQGFARSGSVTTPTVPSTTTTPGGAA